MTIHVRASSGSAYCNPLLAVPHSYIKPGLDPNLKYLKKLPIFSGMKGVKVIEMIGVLLSNQLV